MRTGLPRAASSASGASIPPQPHRGSVYAAASPCAARAKLARVYKAGLIGVYDKLGPVPCMQLNHRPAHVRLGGRRAHHEPLRDLVVRESFGYQSHDLALTFGETVQFRNGSRSPSTRRELRDEPSRHAGGEQRVATRDGPHSRDQLRRLGVLDQEAAGAGAKRLEDVFVQVEGGQHHDAHIVKPLVGDDVLGGGQAVAPRHADVHQHDVGDELPGLRRRFRTVGCLADHLDVLLCVEQRTQSRPHQRLVVRKQHTDHEISRPPLTSAGLARPSSVAGPSAPFPPPAPVESEIPAPPGTRLIGSRARTRKPWPGSGRAVSSPPSRRARSRMPAMPFPPALGLLLACTPPSAPRPLLAFWLTAPEVTPRPSSWISMPRPVSP